jgi:hemerythrin superfamily protein
MATPKTSRKSIPDKNDAIALLKADHRQVEEAFEQFKKARDADRRQKLATQICNALKVHTTIEEEIFYPAFLAATNDTDVHHEAEVEHDSAKKLIAEIEACSPDDEYFKAKVSVLSEMIRHHVDEEEKRGGMFSEARHADMDLVALGEQLAARKSELEEPDARKGARPATSSSRGNGNAEVGEELWSSRDDDRRHRHAGR